MSPQLKISALGVGDGLAEGLGEADEVAMGVGSMGGAGSFKYISKSSVYTYILLCLVKV